MKKLFVCNGRWYANGQSYHAYACAYTKKQIVEMGAKADNIHLTYNELRVYWHMGLWCNSMESIMPPEKREVGIWLQSHYETPVRIIGADGELTAEGKAFLGRK